MPHSAIVTTDLPGLPVRRGKVRDVYEWDGRILLVATDRISAFDCVMPVGIPGKGRILTALSSFWFQRIAPTMPHHLIETIDRSVPPALAQYAAQLRGRTMLCRKTTVVPIECVARGYLAGSGWKEYQADGTVCGISLPPGLKQCDRLPEPIFTPATKAESGHDENISFARMKNLVGVETAETLRDKTLAIYRDAAEYARQRGVLIADTKFEFGRDSDGRLLLIDEVLTPDSSRFWPADRYAPGRDQDSYDKQYVRNYLQDLCDRGLWDKSPPAPPLPDFVVQNTAKLYAQAFECLTGGQFD